MKDLFGGVVWKNNGPITHWKVRATAGRACNSWSCVLLLVVVAEVADPDVAVLDRVAVPLQGDGAFFGVILGVGGVLLVSGWAEVVLSCLNDDAIEENRDLRRGDDFSVFGNGGFKNDVVALPFTLRRGGINEGRILTIHGSGLPVGVGLVGVAFEDLDFVFPHEEDSRVTTTLAFDFTISGDAVFEMNLAVAEFLLGFEFAL